MPAGQCINVKLTEDALALLCIAMLLHCVVVMQYYLMFVSSVSLTLIPHPAGMSEQCPCLGPCNLRVPGNFKQSKYASMQQRQNVSLRRKSEDIFRHVK